MAPGRGLLLIVVCHISLQGIAGHGFYDDCVVPIIENTARECELTDRLQVGLIVRVRGGMSQSW